jgi:hypothetical protein
MLHLGDTNGGIQHRAPVGSVSAVDELRILVDNLERGLLSREEFDLMKAKLMGR